MLIITLPDGSQKQFPAAVTVLQVAQSIGAGLAKAALAGAVDDRLVDTSYLIESDATLSIITGKDSAGLEVIRHSMAHLLAQAVKQLFPTAQVTIGPVIEDGFYYDFAYERPFTPEDLQRIELKMLELVQANLPVTRHEMTRATAIKFFENQGEHYKAKIIADIPAEQTLMAYQQGEFTDLCRGPHVPSTGHLQVFKLTKVAGAYWRGDANNEMLQRIYGTAWAAKKDLDAYLKRLEEAEKRDHRKIAKALDLFHLQEEAPGMVFWHPDGWTVYQTIERYMREMACKHGYQEIRTPQLADISLWERSGHKEKFSDDMFLLEADEREYAIKPMSCPCHIQIFNQGLKSYRELPLRFAEFGLCHRNEASGALHGLFRTRGFTQDDGHIFCTEEQIQTEVARFIEMLFEVYTNFGFTEVQVKLSTRPVKRVGSDAMWDKAEQALADALNAKQLDWQEQPGEGAFYGPKIEFILRDCLGRMWTTGSIQLDFSMPVRLGAEYVGEDNTRKTPVMLHRAICGSLERFLGMLLEHYAGLLPVWLMPTQIVVLTITDKQDDYAKNLAQILQNKGFRVKADLRNEKIGFKIREQTLRRVPYLLIVGEQEVENNTLAVRTRSCKDLGTQTIATFVQLMTEQSHQADI